MRMNGTKAQKEQDGWLGLIEMKRNLIAVVVLEKDATSVKSKEEEADLQPTLKDKVVKKLILIVEALIQELVQLLVEQGPLNKGRLLFAKEQKMQPFPLRDLDLTE